MFNHRTIKKNRRLTLRDSSGMSYVELIVVISIISILIAISLVNYRDFQNKVEMKNLANDVGLKIIEAQKTAVSGKMPLSTELYSDYDDGWRPSYGLYFNLEEEYTESDIHYDGNKVFHYFVDLNQYDSGTNGYNKGMQNVQNNCISGAGECLDVYKITKGSYIEKIDLYDNFGDVSSSDVKQINIIYTRPDQSAFFYNKNGENFEDEIGKPISYAKISLRNAYSQMTSSVYIYSSGRVQINQNI